MTKRRKPTEKAVALHANLCGSGPKRKHEPPSPEEIRRGRIRRQLEARLDEIKLERELRDMEWE